MTTRQPPPPSPARDFADQLSAFVRISWPEMHVLILAVHPSVPENCVLAASNRTKPTAAKLLREQADALEGDLSTEQVR